MTNPPLLLATELIVDDHTRPITKTARRPLIAPSSDGVCPVISTRKDWTLPPKPKPGRKPALEAPPTKRKVQNREAQRAFRERRAAKVGELEDQIKAMEEEDAREQEQLGGIIARLQHELKESQDSLEIYKSRCATIQVHWEEERQTNARLRSEISGAWKDGYSPTNASSLPPGETPGLENNPIEQPEGGEIRIDPSEAADLTCGRCTNGTQCKCIDDAIDIARISTNDNTNVVTQGSVALKRSHCPAELSVESKKRLCQQNEPNEIDFTSTFSRLRPPPPSDSNISLRNPAIVAGDPCGFCNDSSACICAELYRQGTDSKDADTTVSPELCTNNPGSCTQCQGDPRCTLFCKSLASSRPNPHLAYTSSEAQQFRIPAATSTTGPTLTCADAFTTLARHPAFSRASSALGDWVPQLAARYVPTTTKYAPNPQGRTALEVEAASVMSVIKFFDRTYGDGGGGVHHAVG